MHATNYENTLAFVHALNRKPRKPGLVEQTWRIFAGIAEGVRAANDFKDMTRHGVAPEKAVRTIFERIQR